jgi:hypothetical protein
VLGEPKTDGLFEGRLTAARNRAFVGRAAELEQFRAALAGEYAVLYLHGPGGIGKSMLLRRFAVEARSAGRPVIEVDGRMVDPTPAEFQQLLAGALTEPGSVVLVDTFFEHCDTLETWLWDQYLPRLPVGTVVVIAGREPPATRWVADPGWAGLSRVVAVRELARAEAGAFLHARGVPADAHDVVLRFTGGYPLALALAAAVTANDQTAYEDWVPSRCIVETLLAQLIGDVPSPSHRRALEVCAHAMVTTEDLLRATHGDDAAEMFSWLRALPFVDTSGFGLYPHDVVRESLERDLRWRDPQGYQDMHQRLHDRLVEKIRSVGEDTVQCAVGALLYLYRAEPEVANFITWSAVGAVCEAPAQPRDFPKVLELVEAAEGPESARWARYWLERQPEAFRTYRMEADAEPVAFSAWIELTGPPDGDDPVVAAAWRHVQTAGPLRDGERVAIARFAVHPSMYQQTSPVMDMMSWRALGEIFRCDRLAWSFIVLRDSADWGEHLRHLTHDQLPAAVGVGEWKYALYTHDWRVRSARQWLPGGSEVDGHVVLARDEFDAAVRDALRALRSRVVPDSNPLNRTRLVDGTALRDVLTEAVEALRAEPGGERFHRVMVATFLNGAGTQEAAAQRLRLPFSTYRRHLGNAIERVCELLWQRELSRSEQ